MQSSHKRPRAADVHALLEQSPVFSVLDKAGRSRLVKAFKWFYAVAGEHTNVLCHWALQLK